MKLYAGLDVSLKEISICVVDEAGAIRIRGSVACEPEAVVRFFAEKQITPALMVHESGQLSIWLQCSLTDLKMPVTCIDARIAHKALSAQLNKADAADAEGLAQLARTGWFTPDHIRSPEPDRLRTKISARSHLVHLRMELEGHIRGVLKTFGIRMTAIRQGKNRRGFRDQLSEAAMDDPILAAIADGFIASHETLCKAAVCLEEEVRKTARGSELIRRLMSIPGVGPIVTLNFIALIDYLNRFQRVSDVGAFLGLTPRRYQSDEMDYSGHISKCGDSAMRGLLFDAATSLICWVQRFSPLKSWAVWLAGRIDFKKAAVAAACKIAVLMLTLWKNGTVKRGSIMGHGSGCFVQL